MITQQPVRGWCPEPKAGKRQKRGTQVPAHPSCHDTRAREAICSLSTPQERQPIVTYYADQLGRGRVADLSRDSTPAAPDA